MVGCVNKMIPDSGMLLQAVLITMGLNCMETITWLYTYILKITADKYNGDKINTI